MPGKRFTLSQRLRIAGIGLIGRIAIAAIGRTLRFRVDGWENYQRIRDEGRPVILSFWHDQIFSATYFWRHRSIVVITSEHFDGEYIARIIESFGYGTARGSSSRGGVRALLRLKRSLEQGRDAAFTIDGPRGPRHQVKAGPLWLCRKTGCPIVCFQLEPKRYWEFKSWDRMRIPKPFSELRVRIGAPFVPVPESTESEALDAYQEEMEQVTREARYPAG